MTDLSLTTYIALAAALVLCCVSGAMAAAFSFAIASYRFSAIEDRKSQKNAAELTQTAKFFVERSARVGSLISMLRRSLFAVEVFCGTLLAIGAASVAFGSAGAGIIAASLIAASAILLVLQYAFLDYPLAWYGRRNPVKTINALAPAFYVAYAAYLPIEVAAHKLGSKILGKKIYAKDEFFDYIDVEVMLRAEHSDTESISPYTGKILNNALRMNELDVSDVMLPRSQVAYLDADASAKENLALAKRSGHTRYPLCRDNLDNCFGIIHIKDILDKAFENGKIEDIDFMKIRHDTIRLRESDKLETAILKLLKYKLHMAIVEDEFGGTIGVLTLDAALSQLVGKIRDEFDNNSQEQTIQAMGKNKYKISGSASLHRVEDFLDVDFKTDEVSTFGGLITLRLGRFPERGERIFFSQQRIRITVESVHERMVGDCIVQVEEPELPL